MTTKLEDRIRRYSADEIKEIGGGKNISPDDITFLTAIHSYALIVDGKLFGAKTVDIPVIQTDTHQTGIYKEQGQMPVIIINEEQSILDYDFISALHPLEGADVYLWISHAWVDVGADLGIHGEWYRRDVYSDNMEKFKELPLTWEDLAPEEVKY